MNRRQLRLVLGFLSVFVLLSVAPTLQEVGAGSTALLDNAALTDGAGNLLLVFAGGLLLSGGIIAARRRRLARPGRKAAVKSAAHAMTRRSTDRDCAFAIAESTITRELRKESERGTRAPELARQFGLSQDAVRAALGRAPTAPAARSGNSLRNRKPAPSAPARGAALTRRRTPYEITA
jgi:hypothetical protein